MKKVIGITIAFLATAFTGIVVGMMLLGSGTVDWLNFGGSNAKKATDFQYPVQFEGFQGHEMSFQMKDTVISHKVTRMNAGGGETVFVYHYRIRYTGKEDALFRWKVLDRLLDKPVMVHLKSGMTGWKEFKVSSASPPEFYNGEAILFSSKDGVFSKSDSGPRPGPVPDRFGSNK